jgi:hypothetical protein
VYRESLIELILTLRELFRLPLRQSSGFVSNLLLNMGINWQLQDYTALSRRMKKLEVKYCIRASLINRFNKLGLPKYAV